MRYRMRLLHIIQCASCIDARAVDAVWSSVVSIQSLGVYSAVLLDSVMQCEEEPCGVFLHHVVWIWRL